MTDDLLWRHLKTVPAFRAVLRSVEARFFQAIDLPGPLLDVGCGDGNFAEMAFDRKIDVGIDPWWPPLTKGAESGRYHTVMQAMGDELPFPDHTFASAFSNSVLEHIPDIQPVLNEVGRVLQPNGRFVITMPSHRFTENLGGAAFFERLGMAGMADRYRTFFNTISRHAHTDPAEIWAERLAQSGMAVERWQYYFSKEALRALEIGHIQGAPAAAMRALTGHWVVAPWESSLRPVEQWLRPYYEEPFPADGAYLLIIARKISDTPTTATLPPAHPFTHTELTPPQQPEPTPIQPAQVAHPLIPSPPQAQLAHPITPSPLHPLKRSLPTTAPPRPIIPTLLIAFSLIAAIFAQSIFADNPINVGSGLRWLGISFLALLLIAWWQRPQSGNAAITLPNIRAIPRRRWWVFFALILAWLAQRFGSSGSDWAALLLWISGSATAVYALWSPTAPTAPPPPITNSNESSRFTAIATIALFVMALLLRAFNVTNHPFILNGIEASLGLDAVAVLQNTIRNPFTTGWLTNPTFPAYLQALPIALLGQTTLAIRFWSPLIGALTVAATFLIGQKLYGRAVGLTAALLLTGQHLHLHYSRIGMTNIWDGLLVLLALGLIAIAWNQPAQTNRKTWLLAGTAVGLSAYFFTSARFLPIILAALFLGMTLFDRSTLRQQARHLLSMALLATVIALPMMLTYQQNPDTFMERANTLGIFDGQSGWLTEEATLRNLPASALLTRQISYGLFSFNTGQDMSPAYRPARTLLSFWPAVLFLLGMGWALLHGRKLRYQMLFIWVLVTLIFGAALLIQPPNSHRLVIAAPALALLAALALAEMGGRLMAWLPGGDARQNYLLPLLLIIAALLTLGDVAFYYGRYRQLHQFADRNTEIADRIADTLNDLDGDWTIYFYGPPSMYANFPNLTYLAPDYLPGVNLIDVSPDAPLPSSDGDALYIVLPENAAALNAIRAAYPNGIEATTDGYYATPLFTTYSVLK